MYTDWSPDRDAAGYEVPLSVTVVQLCGSCGEQCRLSQHVTISRRCRSSPLTIDTAMILLFVSWWPEEHFEYEWHLTDVEIARLDKRGVAVQRISGEVLQSPGSPANLWRRLQFSWDLVRLGSKADLVIGYMDSPTSRLVALFKRLGLLRKPKVVITDFWLRPPVGPGARQRLKRLFLRHIYGCVDAVIFDTEPGRVLYVDQRLLGPRPRLEYLPCGAMTKKVRLLARASAQPIASVRVDGTYYFAVGKTHRDFATVIAAARMAPHQQYVIMTPNDLPSDLPPNVYVAQWGPYDEYLDFLRGSKATIVPLLPGEDAAGVRALYEAWSLGVPTIVARCDGISDYLSIAGEPAGSYLPGDAAGLAQAVSEIEADPSLAAEWARRGLKAVNETLSSGTYMRRLLPVLSRVMFSSSTTWANERDA